MPKQLEARHLEAKVALITGAKGGLGTHVTRAFLDAGALVAGVSRSIRDADFPHPNFAAIPGELTSADDAEAVAAAAAARFGRIDVLVHTVGGFAGGTPVAATSPDVLDRMLDLNLRTAFFIVRAVLPHMADRGGRIVAISSRAAVEDNANAGAYSASKAALVALMRAVSLENKDFGITANTILPGTMDTPDNRKAMPDADFKTWIDPERVAQAIVWLAADPQAAITGAGIVI